ncbi:MAG: hypothetical protein IKO49_03840 [Bacilli bacterium]|nr:hypothetical protein [Clostridia bacterium]MBR4618418.1 hypothetical protein [Bacilli bacterium]
MSDLIKFKSYMCYHLNKLRKTVYPCKKCHNDKLNFDNFRGWTVFSIRCTNCGQCISRTDPEETINEWNKANKE